MLELVKRAGRIIVRPAWAFAEVGQERLRRSALYLLALLLADSLLLLAGGLVLRPVLAAAYAGPYPLLNWLALVMIVPLVVGMGFAGAALTGLALHPFVLLFGGRKGLVQTLKAVIYAATPAVLSLWLPPLLLIAIIWALALAVVGVRQLHGLSTVRATLAVALPLAVLGGLSVAMGR